MGYGPVSETLAFDIRLEFPGFSLEVAEDVPLQGITALSGPSASGKTTLLRVLAGLERGAQGSVRFAGEDWTRLPPAKRGVGYVFQDARLFPHLSVAENLGYGAARRGVPAQQIDAVVVALDLGPLMDRRPETLSGGETRRVALGRALASGPRVLFLDEPLTGLDRARKAELIPYIARAVASFGVPALYVTHSAMEITHLADRVLGIEGGRLQGWRPAAPRITGRVVAENEGQVTLEVAVQAVQVPGSGKTGELWAVAIPRDAVLLTRDPSETSAGLVLQGQVTGFSEGLVQCRFAGAELELPWQGGALTEGQPVWLALPTVAGRPLWEDRDSR